VLLEARQWIVRNPGAGQENATDAAAQHQTGSDKVSFVLDAIVLHWRDYWLLMVLLFAIVLMLASPLGSKIIAMLQAFAKQSRDRNQLMQACRSNDPTEARHQLLKWGRARWPWAGIVGLHQIEAVLRSNELTLELRRLDAVLYSNRKPDWQGDRLWRLIQAERRRRSPTPGTTDSMPGLYAQRV
jgi:hypothetical protein